MKNSKRKKSENIYSMFVEALGAERISIDDIGMRLRFDLSDSIQMEQFQRFGELTNHMRLKYSNLWGKEVGEDISLDYLTQIEKNPSNSIINGPAVVTVLVPQHGDMDFFANVAHHLRIRSDRDEVEVRRPILEGDSADSLPKATGKAWSRVSGSGYYNDIFAMTERPANRSQQKKQIAVLGNALLPGRYAHVEVSNWQEEMARVDEKRNRSEDDLVTAIPDYWVRRTTNLGEKSRENPLFKAAFSTL